jgi:hypothetical protein
LPLQKGHGLNAVGSHEQLDAMVSTQQDFPHHSDVTRIVLNQKNSKGHILFYFSSFASKLDAVSAQSAVLDQIEHIMLFAARNQRTILEGFVANR